ncbi:putative trichohyalin [Apostichopus japonicus]|uniref:Putative trichohyalin n=1 Tax=Stichopus japonicus TaxID=307972 RepID=A0A2G8LJ28_STIJA|nr:putative trichohyalin [Apostichopus japonicus]
MQRSSSPYVGRSLHGVISDHSPSSYRQSPVPSMFDQESVLGITNNADTSFELMSAAQLREQLRREQSKRKDTEAEVAALKQSTGSFSTPGHAPNPLLSRARLNGGTQQDSDSGISYAHSNSRKSPYHMRPPSPIVNPDVPVTSYNHERGVRQSSPVNGTTSNDLESWMNTPGSGALKNLRDAMYESEQRRLALVEKLKEAHETLQQQTDRLIVSETKLNDTHHTLDSLNNANQTLQKKILDLEEGMEQSMSEKVDSIKNRERLQSRVDELEREMKGYASLQASLQAEQTKRDLIVDQTSRALSMVEVENKTLQQTRETMVKEALALRESLNILRGKNEKLEAASKELDKSRQRGEELSIENSDLRSHLSSSERTVADLTQQVEHIREHLRKSNQDREVFMKQASEAEEKCADLNSKCISSMAAKERYMQEKLDMQQVMRQALADKEQEQSAKQILDAKLTEMQLEVTQRKLAAEKAEEDSEKLSEELNAVKKVCEVLSQNLHQLKMDLENTQEELRNVTADKRSAQQQQTYWEGEAKRIAGERDGLSKSLEIAKEVFPRERSVGGEILGNKGLDERCKVRENKYLTRCQELETMLQRANDDLKTHTEKHQDEMEEWKTTCDRLSSNLGRKDSQVTELNDRFNEAHKQISELKVNLQDAVDKQEKLLEYRDEADKLKQENEKLVQEHGEDQQVINLLEMQKNILSQSQAAGVPKHSAEQMQADIDHLKAELGLAEDKIAELREELAARDKMQTEVDGNGIVTWSARSTPAFCERCSSFKEQVNNLKQMNELLSGKLEKLDSLNTSNSELQHATNVAEERLKELTMKNRSMDDLNNLLNQKISQLEKEKAEMLISNSKGEVITKAEYDQLQSEKYKVELNYESLKQQYVELQNKHKQCMSDQLSQSLGLTGSPPVRRDQVEDLRKYRQENDILQRQIELLRSQCVLADNGKKRAEDRIRDLERELIELQQQLSVERERNITTPEMEAALKTQIQDRDQIIRQLQTDVATKNVALENCQRDCDNRLTEKRREMDRLLKEKEEWNTLRRKLEQDKVVLEIKVQELQLLLDQLNNEKPRLLQNRDSHFTQLEEEAHQANKNIKKLQIDIKNLEDQLKQKDQELLTLRLRQNSDLDTLQEANSRQTKEIQLNTLKKENQMSEMRQEIQRKNEEFRDLLQEKTQKEIELEQVRSEASRTVEHLTSIVERQENEIANLREEMTDKEDQLKGLKNSQTTDVESLKEMLNEANREISKRRTVRDSSINEMEELMKKQEEEYRKIIAKKEKMIAVLTDEMEEERTKKPGLQQSMDEVEQELFEVRSELQRVNGTIRLRESQLGEQERSLNEAEVLNQKLQKEVKLLTKDKEAEIQERNQIVSEMQQKLDEMINENSVLQEVNKTIEERKGGSDGRIKRLEDKVKGQIEEMQGLNKQLANLQTRNRKLDQNNEGLQKELEELREDKSKCKQCEQSKGQFEKMTKQKETLEEENEDLIREIERLESLLNIHMQDGKQEQKTTPVLKSKIPLRDKDGSRQSSGAPTPKESQSPKDGKAANPQQLAQALRRLSTKPGAKANKLSPNVSDSDERRKSRDMPAVSGYDESRRTSLNDLEARIQRLSSSQQKSMKDLRKSSLKPESDSKSSEKTTPRKQAHFVLPSSKKFDKSPASTLSASLGSSRKEEK